MKYDSYVYLLPPRAERAVMPTTLGFYQGRGWVAQVKKNGTNSVIFVPPNGEVFAKTRHADDPDHKAWSFTDGSRGAFDSVRTPGWSVYNAELMHSKGNGIRDTNYIHDVLVYDGEYLLGKTYQYRHDLLMKIFSVRKLKGPESHHVVDAHTWVAKNHTSGFKPLFDRLGNEDEGLVLKNPLGTLQA
jgi:hypothetical protein